MGIEAAQGQDGVQFQVLKFALANIVLDNVRKSCSGIRQREDTPMSFGGSAPKAAPLQLAPVPPPPPLPKASEAPADMAIADAQQRKGFASTLLSGDLDNTKTKKTLLGG